MRLEKVLCLPSQYDCSHSQPACECICYESIQIWSGEFLPADQFGINESLDQEYQDLRTCQDRKVCTDGVAQDVVAQPDHNVQKDLRDHIDTDDCKHALLRIFHKEHADHDLGYDRNEQAQNDRVVVLPVFHNTVQRLACIEQQLSVFDGDRQLCVKDCSRIGFFRKQE